MNLQTLIPDQLPAYDLRYTAGGTDNIGREFYIEIHERSSGFSTPMPVSLKMFGNEPVSLKLSYSDNDFFKPISGSSLDVDFHGSTAFRLLNIARGDETRYKMKAFIGTTLMFEGFVRPALYNQLYGKNQGYAVRISASDGIGLLRDIPFQVNGKIPGYRFHKIRHLLSYLLYLAGNRVPWRDYVAYHNLSTNDYSQPAPWPDYNYFYGSEITLVDFHGLSCYDVLEKLLRSFEMQLISHQGRYIVRLADEVQNHIYDEYSYRGDLLSSADTDTAAPLLDMWQKFRGQRGNVNIEKPVRSLTLTRPYVPAGNLVYNNDFSKGYAGWSDGGQGAYREGWEINEQYKYLRINRRHEYNDQPWWVETEISRGGLGAGVTTQRVLVTMEANPLEQSIHHAKCSFNDETPVTISSTSTTPGGWQRLEGVMKIPLASAVVYFRIHSSIGGSFEFSPLERVLYRNIKIVAIQPEAFSYGEYIQYDGKSEEEDVIINENNRNNVTWNMTMPQGGWKPDYRYEFPVRVGTLRKRIKEAALDYIEEQRYEHLRTRLITYYSKNRIRLKLDMRPRPTDPGILNPIQLVADKYTRASYSIMQATYFFRGALYQCELMEAEPYTEPGPVPGVWLLETGFWNDEGEWMDAETWIDAFYNLQIKVIDASQQPVQNAEVRIIDTHSTEHTETTDADGMTSFINIPQGNIVIDIRLSGPFSNYDSFLLNDYQDILQYELR